LKVINRIHFGEFLLSDEQVKVLVDEVNELEMEIVKKGKLIAFKISLHNAKLGNLKNKNVDQ
jgi:hypothetical protein